ncbi:polyferredoxin [Rhizobium binae]|uniref:Polyferredoxin n=1 Tax=Rhizobium binae TaxID=1138190 RepID=A0ABV2MM90_9HYPH|nr:hypothetical protein [Rhizobium binae]MBX4993798.1 hypothetical protein [Rhizobium binae]NKL46863.1 hypothetical protein [Rhizobium leguminosarum bv. viciae]QSY83321.1 hypothetical protein J2J99_05780 [Rhizobium binae]
MQTDHQPNKPSRKAITIAAILAAVVAIASWAPLQKTLLRRVIDQFPIELTMLLAGVLTAGWLCYFIGRRDALHALRPSDLSIGWSRNDFSAVLKYAAHILVRAPFAVFLLPIRGWKQARANGEGAIFSVMNCLLGGVLGFMVTFATLLLVAIPIQIAFEGG